MKILTKQTRLVFRLTIAVGMIFLICVSALAQDLRHRLQTKFTQVQTGVRALVQAGDNPAGIFVVLKQIKPALDAGHPEKAEALLDQALAMIKQEQKKPSASKSSPLPISTRIEPSSDLYANPAPVTIAGYHGSAMEPFISPDGHYLFFNNQNDPGVNTDLRFAVRTGKTTFRYLGLLPGVNSPVLDAVASMDRAGHFYFTTPRSYARTQNLIYTGEFDGKAVKNVRPAPWDIRSNVPGAIDMDTSVSPDGRTLYISRAVIVSGLPAPKSSVIFIAQRIRGQFQEVPGSAQIMKNINVDGLNYAAAISSDGLELYFTRASQRMAGASAPGASMRIMTATRTSITAPFGEARVLRKITGFVEAPSISLDRKEMFYHKREGNKCVIYRASRS
ncbi:hypothetical protein CCAX7_33220 [Capsulimonas corticalis]|uniref:Uncharacterized protein n=1 Tax=Capsulimonas corticalis TaxID=2219043 RepID=A0A402CYK5_9BACT|nr:PD40 domain-containing protein [Capsulimonas corticalis]BDI31271.1 hypothetical protein CCAX7_33220 [Capsulimonas corticalis]